MTEHPAAHLFPLMADEDLLALAHDIRRHGLREPIVTLDGALLDGRNRLRACELTGVEPRFEEARLDGLSPTEYVVSLNLHRRHLTIAQRAALAVALLPHLEAEAKARQGARTDIRPETDECSSGRSDEKAAEIVGVGRSTIAAVKAIQKRDPEVVERMRSGEIKTVAAGAREAGYESMAQNASRVLEHVTTDAAGRAQPTVMYGRGDKFHESVEPIRRYLAAWRNRGFEFIHVPPKEARKRLAALEEIAEGIERARIDLESRCETARLRI